MLKVCGKIRRAPEESTLLLTPCRPDKERNLSRGEVE